MKTLILPLKRKWFDLIKSGEKKEEYRETSGYWTSRLLKYSLGEICVAATKSPYSMTHFEDLNKMTLVGVNLRSPTSDGRLV